MDHAGGHHRTSRRRSTGRSRSARTASWSASRPPPSRRRCRPRSSSPAARSTPTPSTTRTCTSGGATTSPRPTINLTFFKEGWRRCREYLHRARTAANAAGGLGTPAGDAAFEASSLNAASTRNYNTTSDDLLDDRAVEPDVRERCSAATTPTRGPGTRYIALRAILGKDQLQPGAGTEIQQRPTAAARSPRRSWRPRSSKWLPNPSAACQAKLDDVLPPVVGHRLPARRRRQQAADHRPRPGRPELL